MRLISSYEEKELLLQVAEGDEKAFRQLFELYGKLLYPFLFRMVKSQAVAEELIQEVMLRVWLKRDQLQDVDHPRQWVFKIAANLAFTKIKRTLLESRVIQELQKRPKGYESFENDLQLNELKRHVQEVVKELPPQRRRIYQLSREEGMSREEIATYLNISKSTVKNSIFNSLQIIREHLKRVGYLLILLYLS